MYVWPYLAELPLGKLTSAQQVDLYRLMTHDEVKTMKEFGDYSYQEEIFAAISEELEIPGTNAASDGTHITTEGR